MEHLKFERLDYLKGLLLGAIIAYILQRIASHLSLL